MPKTTIIVIVDNEDEVLAVDAWFEKWRSALRYVSEDFGCGCCVNSWQVEGPAAALEELPHSVRNDEE